MFELTYQKINEIVGGNLVGNPDQISSGLNRIEHISEGEVSFLSSDRFIDLANKSELGLLLVTENLKSELKRKDNYILVPNAYEAFIRLLVFVDTNFINKKSGVHPSAVIDRTTKVSESAIIMENVVIHQGCIVGDNVKIFPNVTIYRDTVIGDNSIIHAGAVIGSDGFGYADMPDGSYFKIPQLGNVIIGKNVEIGANTTIDRAIAGSTNIGDGVKIDNLVHVGHNTEVGENTAFAAQVGISGSVKIGKRVRMGGQVGSAGHLEVADDVTIIAQSGLSKSVYEKGTYFGSPIKPQRDAFRIEAALRNLPDILSKIKDLEKRISD